MAYQCPSEVPSRGICFGSKSHSRKGRYHFVSDDCCSAADEIVDKVQRRAIVSVFIINFSFFIIEGLAGVFAHSSALLADAVDMGGDALVYFLSFLALNKSLKSKAKVAMFNSGFELLLGVGVLIEVTSKIFRSVEPISITMLIVGSLALIANLSCGTILLAHRHKDINMRAVWLCTRNDIINNFVTLVAAGFVYLFGSKWPDIMGGFLIAGLIVYFSSRIFLESIGEHFKAFPGRNIKTEQNKSPQSHQQNS